MRIDKLYDRLASKFGVSVEGGGNSVVRPSKGYAMVRVGDYGSGIDDGFKRSMADTYSPIVAVSKHFVRKPLYRITATRGGDRASVVTTNDHTCAVYNDLHREMLEDLNVRHVTWTEETWKKYRLSNLVSFKAARDVRVGDKVPFLRSLGFEHFCKESDGANRLLTMASIVSYGCDGVGTVESVEEIDNSKGCFVYDIEVAGDRHVYYANGILVHNSQFINLSPITKAKCREAGIDEGTRFSELPKDVREVVVKDAYHILDEVNANVERLINGACRTSRGNVLHYSLEYIASEGFYFKPKHYIVHKVIEDDRPCDKFKYSGISVKKAEIPAEMKTFLKDIYEHTMTDDWRESDYVKRVEAAFNNYLSLDWNQLAYYRKYRTPKDSVSLTESVKGAGVHARAANIYNNLLKELDLGGKYPEISIGDEFRYSYVLPTNRYGVDVIGFKGSFPEEFRNIFTPDYITMFGKIFTKSLENYIRIMGYEKIDPSKRTEDPSFDIF